jgi:hypothetical protein
MIEITADDISCLNDGQLRALVGLLCEAELQRQGYSRASVTWGGDQNAPDGGLDVRVALPVGTQIVGFIPRAATGFQVKRQDMPPGAIAAEMSPGGSPRQSIVELANIGGAYIIVSSEGSTSDSALHRRRAAMINAVQNLANASALALDFYDRTRVASWVRDNASLILWVRREIGRPMQGWAPFGAWSYPPGGLEAEYLIDQGVMICPRPATSANDLSTLDGIAAIRGILRNPRSVVRLVGLSGVGKTRLAQALFDERIGNDELEPSLAFYTNISDEPDPQPISLASDLVATGTRAILVVDNCTPELHARLSDVAKAPSSLLSVLTVEYDIRDDQPEGTSVYEVQVASVALIEALLLKRFPHISQVDARTAAEFSGGNARVAIALADTVAKGGTLERLSDDLVFQRLFVQRQRQDGRLLKIAQACSLMYSFDGEDLTEGNTGELARIGRMIGESADEVFRATAELLRRDLAQRRGAWRAVLPHAVANKLAIGALQNIPHARIDDSLINGASERITKSFSRRLGYLHTSSEARAIVGDWFSSTGRLFQVWSLSEFHRALFENVLPVDPAAGLAAIERSVPDHAAEHPIAVSSYMPRALRSIAYDPPLFERAANLLRLIATEGDISCAKTASEMHTSLFTAHLSGTHATIEQRVAVARHLINSDRAADRPLGFAALDAMLECIHFSSHYDFRFGARSRDYGSHPRNYREVAHWYRTALTLAAEISRQTSLNAEKVRAIIAANFRGLWSRVCLKDELADLALKITAQVGFWRDGWQAVKQTRNFDEKDRNSDNYRRLSELEARLRPVDLVERVRGKVLARGADYDVDDVALESPGAYASAMERQQAEAEALGKEVARDRDALRILLPDIISGPGNLWPLGVGLAKGAENPRAIWEELVSQFSRSTTAKKDTRTFCGMLWQIREVDPKLANELLNEVLISEPLAHYYPIIQSSVGIDQAGVDRLMRSLDLGLASVPSYSHLSLGRATDRMSGSSLAAFVLALADKTGGQSTALQILHMQYFVDKQDRRPHAPELVAAGQELLAKLELSSSAPRDDYVLGDVIRACLTGDGGYATAQQITENLLAAFEARQTYGFEHNELLQGLLETQPSATLDALFAGPGKTAGFNIFQNASHNQTNPFNHVPEAALLGWANRDPVVRYPAIATVIDAFKSMEHGTTSNWNPFAVTVVHNCPNPVAAMRGLVERFCPHSWSGSRAAILESNAKQLDLFDTRGNQALAAFIAEQKAQLLGEANREREWENKVDKHRDETFE